VLNEKEIMNTQRKVLVEKFIPVSSMIDFMIYKYGEKLLEVRFKKGKYRVYENISEGDLNTILEAPSVGKALMSMVRSKESSSPGILGSFGNLFPKVRISIAS